MQNSPFLPPEFAAQMEAEQRKKQMAQALMQRAMSYGGAQPQGRIASKTPALAWLANLGTMGLAGHSLTGADKRTADIRQKGQQAEQAELTRLQNLPMPQAIAEGEKSAFPTARDWAKTQREKQAKLLERGMAAMQDTDPEGAFRVAQTGQLPEQWKAPDLPAPQFGTDPAGNAYSITQNRKREPNLTYAPKPGASLSVMPGETAAAKAGGEETVKIARETREQMLRATQNLDKAERIAALAKDPRVITGFGAGPAGGLASLGAALGFGGKDAVAKTQQLVSSIAEETLDASIDLKGAITEKEWPRLAQARAGEISYTPEALQTLAYINQAKQFNTYINAAKQRNAVDAMGGAAQNNLKLFPHPGLGSRQFPPELFQEQPDGTVKYIGSIDALLTKPAASGNTPASDPYAGFKVVR